MDEALRRTSKNALFFSNLLKKSQYQHRQLPPKTRPFSHETANGQLKSRSLPTNRAIF